MSVTVNDRLINRPVGHAAGTPRLGAPSGVPTLSRRAPRARPGPERRQLQARAAARIAWRALLGLCQYDGRFTWGLFMTGLVAAGASELGARLNGFVRASRLPGAAAGVVHGDELAWMAGVGFADAGAQQPSRLETLYRIASITKTFTGTAIMQLRDAGRLDLDDPAVAYLPELRSAVSPFTAIEGVTIRRMLSHESGLAAEPPGTDWSVPVYQGAPELTLAQASDIVLTVPPIHSTCGSRSSIRSACQQLALSRSSGRCWTVVRLATAGGPSLMSWTRRQRCRRCGPRAACGPASRIWPGGSPSSCGPTESRLRTRRSWQQPPCARCTSPGTWPTTTGPGPGAFHGAGIAGMTSSGSSTPADFRDSPPRCASIPVRRSEPSPC